MCGIFGVVGVRKAAELVVIGLHGNQHRAVDYAGIASSDGSTIFRETGKGLARQVFTKEVLDRLHGMDAIGHIRYPTVVDDAGKENIQPVLGRHGTTPFAVVHNGTLTNAAALKQFIDPAALTTSMDTEVIVRLIEADTSRNFDDDLDRVLGLLEGSFSLGILLPNRLIAIRDPHGNRPLSIAKLNGGFCISSETCAFPNLGADLAGDVEPGTIVSIRRDGFETRRFADAHEKKCRFEAIYFSHPASRVFGKAVSRFRISLGRALEEASPVPGADIVTPVPDSSNFIAMGYAESGRSGTYFPVIARSHYVGRTFIAATQAQRDVEVAQKFAFTEGEIKGKTIVVVDDSIVRGTTLPKIVGTLYRLGAKAVHVRIGSPPITHSCLYGINTPTERELLASSRDREEIRALVGAASLEFLSLETLKSLSPDPEKHCFACMSGEYW